MKYCIKCLQPDTRPNIEFNEEGICPPCQYMEKFDQIDWDERKNELKEIIKFGKKHNVSGYDCIIGVSGGKDSTRQALYVKDELALKPLLVCCSYPPEQLTETGAENISNLISLGFDTITVSPGPLTWKALMHQGFLKYGNWCKSTEMALYASLPRVAIAYHIPLIFLGENPATQDGELGVGSFNWDGTRMKNANTIKDGPDDLIAGSKDICEQDIIWYRYPSDEEMNWAKLKIVYLGYFWNNFTKIDNGNFSVLQGLEIREDPPQNQGSLCPFECIDEDFVVMNQMIKYMKFGFGKVVEEVSEEIRLGRMKREEGIKLVEKYDGKCDPKYINKFCNYIGISESEFWNVAESFRDKDIWRKNKSGKWKLKVTPE